LWGLEILAAPCGAVFVCASLWETRWFKFILKDEEALAGDCAQGSYELFAQQAFFEAVARVEEKPMLDARL
jgi:hypothetical protein